MSAANTRRDLALGIFGMLVILGLAVGLVAGGWYAIKRVNPAITIAVLGAGTTITVSTLTVTLGRVFERKKMIEAEQRKNWAAMYETFILDWTKYMGLDQPKDKRKTGSDKDAAKFIAAFSAKAMTWASESVLGEWIEWRRMTNNASADPHALMLQFEKVLFAMRKDLGHADKDLPPGFLLRTFIGDWSDAAPEPATADQDRRQDQSRTLPTDS